MTAIRRYVFTLLALVAMPNALAAQGTWVNAPVNDSSLAAVRMVALAVWDVDKQLDSTTVAQLQSAAQLELRKAGIKVTFQSDGASALKGVDALVNIGFFGRRRALTNDLEIRIRVLQWVTVTRTQRPAWYETWLYEKRTETSDSKREAPRLLREGVNDFLTHWLDMNGR